MYYSFDYSTFANVTDGGRISGSTTNSLVISNAMSADNYDYLVVVSNPYGFGHEFRGHGDGAHHQSERSAGRPRWR